MTELKSFINDEEILKALSKKSTKEDVKYVLRKAADPESTGLSLEEAAILLNNTDPEMDEEIFAIPQQVKQHIYGRRMVLFAPLYVSNTCVNNCLYCGFRTDNKSLKRKFLTIPEIQREVEILERMGHKRLLLVYGEANYQPEDLVEDIEAVYAVKTLPSGEIRRVNVNIAPMDVEGFKVLQKAHIGTFQCFQETYHQQTYEKVHVSGPKSNYLYRLYAPHRAMEAGIEDVGIGALYGLYDYKFETLAVLKHAQTLEKDMGVGPHTVSFPRLEPALGSEMSYNPPYQVSDYEMKKIVAVTRLAIPYTGMIISTRERPEFRMDLIKLGISQLSGGSKVSPGTYEDEHVNHEEKQQFMVADERTLDEVIYDLVQHEYLPSFCTGCYRHKRVGDMFMGLAKKAFIKDLCFPNAILTFAEYLRDYASPQTKEAGQKLIQKLLADQGHPKRITDQLDRVHQGVCDVFF